MILPALRLQMLGIILLKGYTKANEVVALWYNSVFQKFLIKI